MSFLRASTTAKLPSFKKTKGAVKDSKKAAETDDDDGEDSALSELADSEEA